MRDVHDLSAWACSLNPSTEKYPMSLSSPSGRPFRNIVFFDMGNINGSGDDTEPNFVEFMVTPNGGTGSNQIYLDNIVANADVSVIPEPSTTLLSLIGMGFLLRRKRR